MLDGLFEAVVGEVGLSQVIVGDYKAEVAFGVVENEQLIQGEFLDLDVD